MTAERLANRLAACRDEGDGVTAGCPDEHVIAGYVDGTLDPAAAAAFGRHLADCSNCLGLVALLSREREAGGSIPAVRDAAGPAENPTVERRNSWQGVQKWAVAATLVLAVPVLFQLARPPDRRTDAQEGTPSATTRMVTPAACGLQVLSPRPGSQVDPARLAFSWTEVPGSPYYDLRVVTDDGDIVAEQRVGGTTWQPPAALRLEPGKEYFVLVEAYPSGDKPVSSHHVPFRVPD